MYKFLLFLHMCSMDLYILGKPKYRLSHMQLMWWGIRQDIKRNLKDTELSVLMKRSSKTLLYMFHIHFKNDMFHNFQRIIHTF